MRRYPHYLRRLPSARWPGRVLCLAVMGREEPAPNGQAVRHESLQRWCALSLLLEDGRYQYHASHAGSDPGQFWRFLHDCLAHPGPVWVLGENCPRAWALLGVWEALASGALVLRPDPERQRRLVVDYIRKHRPRNLDPLEGTPGYIRRRAWGQEQGYLVATPDVSILVARVPDHPGELHWIDLRNFGAVCPPQNAAAGTGPAALAGFWRKWHTALSTLKLGAACHTAGSQAFGGYRHGYYAGGLYCHAHPEALGLEAEGLHGGRVECFRLGVLPGDSYHYDYHNLYPFIMQIHPQPCALLHHTKDPATAAGWVRTEAYRCLARVTVQTDRPLYPVKDGADTIYPVGTFQTVLPGPELEMAARRKQLRAVHEACTYRMGHPLQGYAHVLCQWREHLEEQGDTMLAGAVKQLLVSLTGKLSQRWKRWVPVPGEVADYPFGAWHGVDPQGIPCRFRALGATVEREESGGFAPEACPQVSAWVTSAGRVRLLEAIEAAGWEHVAYVATDSVVTNYAGHVGLGAAGLLWPGRCGYLRLKAGPVETEIRGINYYRVDRRVTCAGLPGGVLTDAGDGLHYYWRPAPEEQIDRGEAPTAVETRHPYPPRPCYRHGIVAADGRVAPHRKEEKC